jgi:hypothetical protein
MSRLDLLRRKVLDMNDIPWLVKDFDVLYRAAQATLEIETIAGAKAARADLRLQLERLRPAFEEIQAVKRALRDTR